MAQVTKKQFGDAGEHRVMSDLTFNGIPAVKMPDNWPGFDIMAVPSNRAPLKISVKARHQATAKGNIKMRTGGDWDWMAIILMPMGGGAPRSWYIPREIVMANSTPLSQINDLPSRRITYQQLFGPLAIYEDNFVLDPAGRPTVLPLAA